MPFRTARRRPIRRFRRRMPIRRRRVVRHRRVFRNNRSPIYNYRQTVEYTNLTIAAGSFNQFFGQTFQLSDIADNIGSFINIYDNYRLMAVKFTVYPQYNTYNANTATVSIPEVFLVVDYNTSTAPTSLTELFAYSNLKRRQAIRPVSRYFRPRARIDGVVNTSGTAAMMVSHKTWMETANTGVNYFAIRGALSSNIAPTVAQNFRVVVTYYIQFKNVK